MFYSDMTYAILLSSFKINLLDFAWKSKNTDPYTYSHVFFIRFNLIDLKKIVLNSSLCTYTYIFFIILVGWNGETFYPNVTEK